MSPWRSPATGVGLLMGIECGGLRPMGAGLVLKGSSPFSAGAGLPEAAVLNEAEAEPERMWSGLAGSLVDEAPLARLMALATVLMCFLPAL